MINLFSCIFTLLLPSILKCLWDNLFGEKHNTRIMFDTNKDVGLKINAEECMSNVLHVMKYSSDFEWGEVEGCCL
jgi:hypothetical protein